MTNRSLQATTRMKGPATRPPRGPRAFTLTELMIALAIIALLLIGIGRIFALTSQTISTGQALSKAVRTQKAVQQTMSADFVGVLPTSADLRPYSGMMPVNTASDADAGMPFLAICNFRTPTYANQSAYRGDAVAPAAFLGTPLNAAKFAAMSRAVRGVDLNGDGTENNTQINLANGEMTPIYFYGDRNFRADTIGFFTRGSFRAQTGVAGTISRVFGTVGTGESSLQSDLNSSEAFVWYGHARVFNSNPQGIDRSAGHRAPGEWPVAQANENQNNQFADQFVLSRMQMVLADPKDHDDRTGSYTPASNGSDGGADRKLAEDNTVVASDDPDRPVLFLQRKWWDPTRHTIDADKPDWRDKSRPFPSPFTINDPIVIFQRDGATAPAGRNRTVYTNDKTSSAGTSTSTGLAAVNYQAAFGRTDIAGVSSNNARKRIRFLQQYDANFPPAQSNGDNDQWWEKMFVTWNTRFWANPFVVSAGFNPDEPNINAKSLAQRQQLLTTGASQFIVEFAGDFLTQRTDLTPANRFGEVIDIVPDGNIDFVVTPTAGRVTRWYGLPRDVDGNGSIPAAPATARTSVDVLPVHRIVPTGLFPSSTITWLPFERTPTPNVGNPLPPSIAPVNGDYAENLDEPANATSPNSSGYVCIWGATDFEFLHTSTLDPATGGLRTTPLQLRGAYPKLIRVIVDVRDEDGKLAEPVRLESVYNVPDEAPAVAN